MTNCNQHMKASFLNIPGLRVSLFSPAMETIETINKKKSENGSAQNPKKLMNLGNEISERNPRRKGDRNLTRSM